MRIWLRWWLCLSLPILSASQNCGLNVSVPLANLTLELPPELTHCGPNDQCALRTSVRPPGRWCDASMKNWPVQPLRIAMTLTLSNLPSHDFACQIQGVIRTLQLWATTPYMRQAAQARADALICVMDDGGAQEWSTFLYGEFAARDSQYAFDYGSWFNTVRRRTPPYDILLGPAYRSWQQGIVAKLDEKANPGYRGVAPSDIVPIIFWASDEVYYEPTYSRSASIMGALESAVNTALSNMEGAGDQSTASPTSNSSGSSNSSSRLLSNNAGSRRLTGSHINNAFDLHPARDQMIANTLRAIRLQTEALPDVEVATSLAIISYPTETEDFRECVSADRFAVDMGYNVSIFEGPQPRRTDGTLRPAFRSVQAHFTASLLDSIVVTDPDVVLLCMSDTFVLEFLSMCNALHYAPGHIVVSRPLDRRTMTALYYRAFNTHYIFEPMPLPPLEDRWTMSSGELGTYADFFESYYRTHAYAPTMQGVQVTAALAAIEAAHKYYTQCTGGDLQDPAACQTMLIPCHLRSCYYDIDVNKRGNDFAAYFRDFRYDSLATFWGSVEFDSRGQRVLDNSSMLTSTRQILPLPQSKREPSTADLIARYHESQIVYVTLNASITYEAQLHMAQQLRASLALQDTSSGRRLSARPQEPGFAPAINLDQEIKLSYRETRNLFSNTDGGLPGATTYTRVPWTSRFLDFYPCQAGCVLGFWGFTEHCFPCPRGTARKEDSIGRVICEPCYGFSYAHAFGLEQCFPGDLTGMVRERAPAERPAALPGYYAYVSPASLGLLDAAPEDVCNGNIVDWTERTRNSRATYFECFPEKLCEGRNECIGHNSGILCQSCESGYSWRTFWAVAIESHVCQKCPPQELLPIVLLGVFGVILGFTWWISWLVDTPFAGSAQGPLLLAVVRHFQIISYILLVSDYRRYVNSAFINYLENIFVLGDIMSRPIDMAYPDCLFADGADVHWGVFGLAMGFHLAGYAANCMYYGLRIFLISRRYNMEVGKMQGSMRHRSDPGATSSPESPPAPKDSCRLYRSALHAMAIRREALGLGRGNLVWATITYNTVLYGCVVAFSCSHSTLEAGQFVRRGNLALECTFQRPMTEWFSLDIVANAVLVLFGFGLPTFIGAVLYKYQNEKFSVGPRKVLGIFLSGVKAEYYWFEFVPHLRTLFVAFSAAWLHENATACYAAILMTVLMYGLVAGELDPYQNVDRCSVNQVTFASNRVLFFTGAIVYALSVRSEGQQPLFATEWLQDLLRVLVVLLNVGFFIVAAYAMLFNHAARAFQAGHSDGVMGYLLTELSKRTAGSNVMCLITKGKDAWIHMGSLNYSERASLKLCLREALGAYIRHEDLTDARSVAFALEEACQRADQGRTASLANHRARKTLAAPNRFTTTSSLGIDSPRANQEVRPMFRNSPSFGERRLHLSWQTSMAGSKDSLSGGMDTLGQQSQSFPSASKATKSLMDWQSKFGGSYDHKHYLTVDQLYNAMRSVIRDLKAHIPTAMRRGESQRSQMPAAWRDVPKSPRRLSQSGEGTPRSDGEATPRFEPQEDIPLSLPASALRTLRASARKDNEDAAEKVQNAGATEDPDDASTLSMDIAYLRSRTKARRAKLSEYESVLQKKVAKSQGILDHQVEVIKNLKERSEIVHKTAPREALGALASFAGVSPREGRSAGGQERSSAEGESKSASLGKLLSGSEPSVPTANETLKTSPRRRDLVIAEMESEDEAPADLRSYSSKPPEPARSLNRRELREFNRRSSLSDNTSSQSFSSHSSAHDLVVQGRLDRPTAEEVIATLGSEPQLASDGRYRSGPEAVTRSPRDSPPAPSRQVEPAKEHASSSTGLQATATGKEAVTRSPRDSPPAPLQQVAPATEHASSSTRPQVSAKGNLAEDPFLTRASEPRPKSLASPEAARAKKQPSPNNPAAMPGRQPPSSSPQLRPQEPQDQKVNGLQPEPPKQHAHKKLSSLLLRGTGGGSSQSSPKGGFDV